MGWLDRATTALKTKLMLKPQKASQDWQSETNWIDCWLKKKKKRINTLLRILTGPECHNIILKMPKIQSKMTQYTKNQENSNNFQGKR